MYLSWFQFPDIEEEYDFMMAQKRNCYDSYYPFLVLSKHSLTRLDFGTITILYGGNGSGKSTALNVMAEKLNLERDTLYNRSGFFEDYTERCSFGAGGASAGICEEDARDGENSPHAAGTFGGKTGRKAVSRAQGTKTLNMPSGSRIITSDDVFDFMLNLRSLNNGIDRKRDELFEDYLDSKYAHFQMRSLEDYDQLKKVNMARSNTQSKYVRKNLMDNVREHSNGESAFRYFTEKITENSLYLLDEPENSLSPERQQELAQFLEDSARFYHCQFVIATHSPFLLSLWGAKIYDMDEERVSIKHWSELANVRAYYDFFKKHEKEFEARPED